MTSFQISYTIGECVHNLFFSQLQWKNTYHGWDNRGSRSHGPQLASNICSHYKTGIWIWIWGHCLLPGSLQWGTKHLKPTDHWAHPCIYGVGWITIRQEGRKWFKRYTSMLWSISGNASIPFCKTQELSLPPSNFVGDIWLAGELIWPPRASRGSWSRHHSCWTQTHSGQLHNLFPISWQHCEAVNVEQCTLVMMGHLWAAMNNTT